MDEKSKNSTPVPKESNLPFHVKYRPKNFDEFRGNESTVKSLKSLLERKDRPHTYLFTGPSGVGKTTLARIIAKELGCHDSEFFEFNTADDRTLDFIRYVIDGSHYLPTMGKVKVFLFDEVHALIPAAQEALLKFAEEPPRHVYLILCTTNPEKLVDTLINRCQLYHLNLLNADTIKTLVDRVLREEKAELSPKISQLVIKASGGNPRTAQMLLHKIIRCSDENEQESILLSDGKGGILKERIIELCRNLVNEPSKEEQNVKWEETRKILKELDSPPEMIRGLIRENMAEALLNVTREDLRGRVNEIIGYFSSGGKDFDKVRLIETCHRVIFEFGEKGKKPKPKRRTKASVLKTA